MSDLVSRLREPRKWITAGHGAVDLCEEAALRIEQLEAALHAYQSAMTAGPYGLGKGQQRVVLFQSDADTRVTQVTKPKDTKR